MTVKVQTLLGAIPRSRRDAIADRWYDAVAGTSFVASSAAEVRQRLCGLTDRVITLLLVEPVDRAAARAIGAALADLHLLQPDTLAGTQETLSVQLVEGLPAAQVAALYPRIAALCAELGRGFVARTCRLVLIEQEEIRAALATEHRHADEGRRESEARFRAIFEEAAIGMALVDMNERRALLVNPALARMLGYEPHELFNVLFSAVTHPDDEATSMTLYRELVAGRRDHYQLEKRYLRKDGGVMWGRLTVSLIRAAGGDALFSIGMVEDVTARKQAEADLAEAQRRLLASRDDGYLHLARELHDGPVQALHGACLHLELLRESVRDADDLAHVNVAQETLQQTAETLRAICLDLRPPALVPFGLEAELRGHLTRFEAAHTGMAVHAQLTPDGQALPEGVRLALYRIYQEAMTNIARHAHAHHVTVRLLTDAEQVLLEIEDDGQGFTVPERLTALMHQGHLGLVGAMERAAAIGGRLEIESAPDRGTRLRVAVPHLDEGEQDG